MPTRLRQRNKAAKKSQNNATIEEINSETSSQDEISEVTDVSPSPIDLSKSQVQKNGVKLKHDEEKPVCQLKDESKSKVTSLTSDHDCSQGAFFNQSSTPLTFRFEIDIAIIILTLAAFFFYMLRLEEPNSIVFDELHYGKFISLYMKRIFFFDSHPPLGKQLIALAGYFVGYDGDTNFEKIGGDYSTQTPLRALRGIPAFFGCLLIPTVYYLILQMGFTSRTAVLATILVIFENIFLTQSRYILMESMLIWFSTFGLLSYLKFRKVDRSFEIGALFWLFASSFSLTSAICVKYSGVYVAFLILGLLTYDYWQMVCDRSVNALTLWVHLFIRFMAVCVIPIIIYLTVFYVHLAILTKAGPNDNIMTSAFQASLEGGLAAITKGQPLEIAHGSQVTLRHTHGRPCWLHSHSQVYPVKYPDNRGSSHQQQVTCYSFKDVNNWWIIKRPDIPDLLVSDPIDKIKHGDIIQLIHGMTSRPLNSHDVAAPMSPSNQEVSCYIDYNISFPVQDLWVVHILNKDTEGDVWHSIHSRVRLIHKNSKQALRYSGKQLPDWGYNQHEVVTDRVIHQDDTIFNVEEHRYTRKTDQKERERDMGMAEFVPLEPTKLTFFEKMWELQYKMFTSNSENIQEHTYSSESLEWLVLTKGIAYWVSPQSNAQIHLLGNVAIWYTATLGLPIYCLILTFYLLRRKRQVYDIPEEVWNKFCVMGQVCLCGYLLNFLPYFVFDQTLFLHHYLPAYLYKLLLLATLVEHISCLLSLVKPLLLRRILCYFFLAVCLIWICCVIYTFFSFIVFCYGFYPLTADEVRNLKWKRTWDFIIHKA